ncbi:MAG: helix-turn-helix domain-containing protein [Nitrospirota bacterium]|nr:helix-turn-helix domain-containing protein [Nitrospirota bacterium]
MKKLRTLRERLKKDLKDPEFKEAFKEEEIFASVAIQIARIRQQEHLTQAELARRMQTTQQTISRLEDTCNNSYALHTLYKVAQALHKELRVELV